MSSYFTRLAERLTPVSAPHPQGKAPAFNSALPNGADIETQVAAATTIEPGSAASNPGSGPALASVAPQDIGSTLPGGAARGTDVAPDSPTPAHAARPADPMAPRPLSQAGHDAPPTHIDTTAARTPAASVPIPLAAAAATATATAAESSAPVQAARRPDPDITAEVEAPTTRQPLPPSSPPAPRAAAPVEYDAATQRQDRVSLKEAPASASNSAPPAGRGRPLAEPQPYSATRSATAPRHQRDPAAPRIDVHIGTITLSVRAPAPAPAPQPAPRPEQRPAFSASRHYLRCP